VADALLDTGVLVALLDRDERNHEACVDFLASFRGRLLTTEPVLTEALHLLGPRHANQEPCLDFVLRGGALLAPATPETLARCRELMRRYRDTPMDFADATLVALGELAGTVDVLTLDRRGFSTYRTRGRRAFRILPGYEDRKHERPSGR
jgi:predicted nucleic acid-binding protein